MVEAHPWKFPRSQNLEQLCEGHQTRLLVRIVNTTLLLEYLEQLCEGHQTRLLVRNVNTTLLLEYLEQLCEGHQTRLLVRIVNTTVLLCTSQATQCEDNCFVVILVDLIIIFYVRCTLHRDESAGLAIGRFWVRFKAIYLRQSTRL